MSNLQLSGIQTRSVAADSFEIIEENQFIGRAIPYNVEQQIGSFTETFAPGTFSRQVKDPSRVKICYQHGEIIGRAIELEERTDGLWIKGAIVDDPDIPDGKKALALLRNRLLSDLSIGFEMAKNGFRIVEDSGRTLVRHTRAKLCEVSLVTTGAYGAAAQVVAVRDSNEDVLEMERLFWKKIRSD